MSRDIAAKEETVQFEFSFPTSAQPEQVVAALTDFSDRRPDIWPSLDRDAFQVQELGDSWAVAKEGSKRPPVWAVERYEWSVESGQVRWSAIDSNFCQPGSGVAVTATATPTGSLVTGTWHREPRGVRGKLIVPMARLALPRTLPREWSGAIERWVASRSGSN